AAWWTSAVQVGDGPRDAPAHRARVPPAAWPVPDRARRASAAAAAAGLAFPAVRRVVPAALVGLAVVAAAAAVRAAAAAHGGCAAHQSAIRRLRTRGSSSAVWCW